MRGKRYRGSTDETKAARASKVAGLKLAQVVENTDPLPKRAPVRSEFSQRFLDWLKNVTLEDKNKTYYHDGWRLLQATSIVGMRLDQITKDVAETLKFSGASSKCQLCFKDTEKNAAQSRGVETDSSRSEIEVEEGAWALAEA